MLLRSIQNTLKDELTNASLKEYRIRSVTIGASTVESRRGGLSWSVVMSLRLSIAGRAVPILMPAKGTLRDSRVSSCDAQDLKVNKGFNRCQPPPIYVRKTKASRQRVR